MFELQISVIAIALRHFSVTIDWAPRRTQLQLSLALVYFSSIAEFNEEKSESEEN